MNTTARSLIALGSMVATGCMTSVAVQAQTATCMGDVLPIDVTSQLTSTGYFLEAGRSYTIRIWGVYAYSTEFQCIGTWLSSSGNGQEPHAGPFPNFPFGSVVAQIGDGPAFLISDQRSFQADTSGELKLWVNDNFTGDNVGTLVAFVLKETQPTSAPEPADPAESALRVFPNPSVDGVVAQFEIEEHGAIELAIIDVGGRVVRSIELGEVGAGFHKARWDGRDESGGLVASGTYFMRVSGNQTSVSRAIVIRR